MAVRVDLNISLDGFATTTDQTPARTRSGPTGRDSSSLRRDPHVPRPSAPRHVRRGNDRRRRQVRAGVLRRGRRGDHGRRHVRVPRRRGDPDWRGWWGDEPPFHVPVFVLTHGARPVLEMAGGTTFHFLARRPARRSTWRRGAAGGKDVRIGGGATVAREFLKAGLVDRLHVAIAPILLGRGIKLWDDLRGFEDGYTVTAEAAESGVTHLTFSR